MMFSFPTTSMAVRADASSAIGTGHIFRCLALTDELRREGGDAVYVCADAPGGLTRMLRDRGYRVELVPDGLTPEEDADATRMVLAPDAIFDWILVDHYGLDQKFESAVRPCARSIVVLDDLANRPHDVDLLIDSSHRPEEKHFYKGLVRPGARMALGASYVLLRQEFLKQRPSERNFRCVRRLLVTLGGNDPVNATGLALDALDDLAFADIQIDVTLGTSNPRLDMHKARAARMTNVAVHVQTPRMPELMAEADLCLGAGGTTSWERCFMGLPSLVLVLADNQREFAARLEREGCARNLGYADRLDAATVRSALIEAISDPAWRERVSRAARKQVDGCGVLRSMKKLSSLSKKQNTESVLSCHQ